MGTSNRKKARLRKWRRKKKEKAERRQQQLRLSQCMLHQRIRKLAWLGSKWKHFGGSRSSDLRIHSAFLNTKSTRTWMHDPRLIVEIAVKSDSKRTPSREWERRVVKVVDSVKMSHSRALEYVEDDGSLWVHVSMECPIQQYLVDDYKRMVTLNDMVGSYSSVPGEVVCKLLASILKKWKEEYDAVPDNS